MTATYIVFDIGGTNTRVGISRDGEKLDQYEKFKTPEDPRQGVAHVQQVARALCGGKTPRRAAGGIAGTFDHDRNTLLRSPHLPGWANTPIKKMLSDALGVPVSLENDSAMVALGEALCGAGKGHDIVAYITVSTGVGGARITNGVIDRSVLGFEPGHQIIDADGNLCPDCAKPGDLENYISGTAIESRFGKHPKDITDQQIWDQLADWLAYGLLNTAAHWSPDVIVLGGSMIVGSPAIPIERTEKKLREVMKNFPSVPKIQKAQLNDIGGLLGSIEYLRKSVY